VVNGKLLRCMVRKGSKASPARTEGLVESSFTGHAFYAIITNSLSIVESPSRFSC